MHVDADRVVGLKIVTGSEVVFVGVDDNVGVAVLGPPEPVEGHFSHWARAVSFLGEHTLKGTWASAQMKAQQGE